MGNSYIGRLLELAALVNQGLMPVREIGVTRGALGLLQEVLRRHVGERRDLVLWKECTSPSVSRVR